MAFALRKPKGFFEDKAGLLWRCLVRVAVVAVPARTTASRGDHARSRAMIRVAGEDRRRAVELFKQNRTRQAVGHRHRSEREQRVGAGAQGRIVPVRTADGEGQVRSPGVAPGGERSSERLGGLRFAAFVQRYQFCAGWKRSDNPGRLFSASGVKRSMVSFAEFPRVACGDADRSASLADPIPVTVAKLRFGATADASDRDDGQSHVVAAG